MAEDFWSTDARAEHQARIFKNEALADLPLKANYCLAGLWCLADKERRLGLNLD